MFSKFIYKIDRIYFLSEVDQSKWLENSSTEKVEREEKATETLILVFHREKLQIYFPRAESHRTLFPLLPKLKYVPALV